MPKPTAQNVPLVPWHRQPGDSAAAVDDVSTRQWLERRASDDVGRGALRSAALGLADGTELSRLDDAQLNDQLFAAMMAGRLRPAAETPVVLRQLTQTAQPAAAPRHTPATSRPRAPTAATSAPAAESTFEPNLDVAAQVAVLQQAAQDGVPFCEECAKSTARRTLAEAPR